MAAANTLTTLNGLFKETYADKLENLLPKGLQIQNDIKWAERAKMPGNKFHQPVLLSHEHGFTYAAAGIQGTSSAGAFTLAAAVAGTTADATIVGTQMALRSQIDYESAARAASGGARAFRRTLDIVVENMFQSSRKRMEIDYFYGSSPLCRVDAAVTPAGTPVTAICLVAMADWAPGIWAGMENAKITIFEGTTSTSQIPAAASHSGSISGVNLVKNGSNQYSVTVEGTSTGAIAAGDLFFWDTAGGASGATSGTFSSNVFEGLFSIMNTSSGSLFSIPVSNSLWQPNQTAIGGALTYAGISDAVASVVAKGLDEDLTLYVNPVVWASLMQLENASDRISWVGNNPKSKTVGSDGVTYLAQNGKVTVKPSNYVKESHGFCIAPRLYKRIGASDLTFRLPDRGDEFFLHLQDKAGYELRAYVNHSLFTKAPGKGILLTGIVG